MLPVVSVVTPDAAGPMLQDVVVALLALQ